MKEGLLWYEENHKSLTLPQQVARAAERYWRKFGVRPDSCYVNSDDLAAHQGCDGRTPEEQRFGCVRVVPAHNVLKHHFWIGIEEREPAG